MGQRADFRIGMVTPWRVRCGIATYSENLATALAKCELESYIVRLHRFGDKNVAYFEHLATRRIPDVPLVHVQSEYGLYQRHELTFYRALKEVHPDKKIVTTVHGTGHREQDAIIGKYSDLVILHNEYQKDNFELEATIIQHGVTARECTPTAIAKEKLGVEGTTIGSFGFISPYKGLEDLIFAAKKLTDITFIMAGGWHVKADTGYIATLKNGSPDNVIWTGFVEDEELPDVMGAMDLCVYPSRFISESGALLTLMGFGKPIIARDIPPNKEKTVFLFKNKEDLVDKINVAFENEHNLNMLAKDSMQYAKDNSWAVISEKHIKEYQQLVS